MLISKMNVKMKFRIITKNHPADSKIRSSEEIDLRVVGTHESHPTALELTLKQLDQSRNS